MLKMKAIENLLPANTLWKLSGDELIIFSEGVKKPTNAQINAEIAKLQNEEEVEKNAKEAKKAAAESKLAALGLTADDLKALGLA